MTTLREVNKEISKRFPGVKLVRGKGYYYVTSDDENLATQIAGLFTSSIYIYDVRNVSLDTMMGWVKGVLEDNQRSKFEAMPVVFMKKKKSASAADAVATQKIRISKMLKALEQLQDFGDGEVKDYGHVGSLGHAVTELEELCRSFQIVIPN